MSFYDININNQLVDILPPDKRNANIQSLAKALNTPLQWAHDMFFNSYYVGSAVSQYATGTYNYLDQVIYLDRVYVSLVSGNTGLPTTSTWELFQPNFIGVQERMLYNGSTLVLTYALNKEFGTVFRQPPLVSDIFITNLAAVKDGFLVGITEPNCSSVGQSTASAAIGSNWTFIFLTHFSVSVPAVVLAAMGVNQITGYIKQYVPASLKFTVIGY